MSRVSNIPRIKDLLLSGNLNFTEIGSLEGLSRERIRQIALTLGITGTLHAGIVDRQRKERRNALVQEAKANMPEWNYSASYVARLLVSRNIPWDPIPISDRLDLLSNEPKVGVFRNALLIKGVKCSTLYSTSFQPPKNRTHHRYHHIGIPNNPWSFIVIAAGVDCYVFPYADIADRSMIYIPDASIPYKPTYENRYPSFPCQKYLEAWDLLQ